MDAGTRELVDVRFSNSSSRPEPICVAAAALPGRVVAEATGRVDGEIIEKPRGTSGFGYDPIFRVKGSPKTMAELTTEEKNKISHRGEAIRILIDELRNSGMFG